MYHNNKTLLLQKRNLLNSEQQHNLGLNNKRAKRKDKKLLTQLESLSYKLEERPPATATSSEDQQAESSVSLSSSCLRELNSLIEEEDAQQASEKNSLPVKVDKQIARKTDAELCDAAETEAAGDPEQLSGSCSGSCSSSSRHSNESSSLLLKILKNTRNPLLSEKLISCARHQKSKRISSAAQTNLKKKKYHPPHGYLCSPPSNSALSSPHDSSHQETSTELASSSGLTTLLLSNKRSSAPSVTVASIDNVFKREGILGEGTYGVVYRALKRDSNQKVALKKFRWESPSDGIPATSVREVVLLRDLVHPNIVSLNGVYYEAPPVENKPPRMFLEFEYIELDLRKYMKMFPERRIPLETIKGILYQILKGLAYCHERRVIHRDIKPNNILLRVVPKSAKKQACSKIAKRKRPAPPILPSSYSSRRRCTASNNQLAAEDKKKKKKKKRDPFPTEIRSDRNIQAKPNNKNRKLDHQDAEQQQQQQQQPKEQLSRCCCYCKLKIKNQQDTRAEKETVAKAIESSFVEGENQLLCSLSPFHNRHTEPVFSHLSSCSSLENSASYIRRTRSFESYSEPNPCEMRKILADTERKKTTATTTTTMSSFLEENKIYNSESKNQRNSKYNKFSKISNLGIVAQTQDCSRFCNCRKSEQQQQQQHIDDNHQIFIEEEAQSFLKKSEGAKHKETGLDNIAKSGLQENKKASSKTDNEDEDDKDEYSKKNQFPVLLGSATTTTTGVPNSQEDLQMKPTGGNGSAVSVSEETTLEVKLADFGLARVIPFPLRPLTREVVTLWYRAPEILVGAPTYTEAVDVWAVGCVFAELLYGRAIFPGEIEIDTLFKIFQLLGTPDEEIWPGVSELPHYKSAWPRWKRRTDRYNYFREELDEHAKDLLDRLLTYDYKKRVTAADALRHPWFDVFHEETNSEEDN